MSKLQINHTKWNLSSLYGNDNDLKMESDREAITIKAYEFINKWKSREDYLNDPVILRTALDEYEDILHSCIWGGDEGYYFWLRTHQDQNDPELKAKHNKVNDFSLKIHNDLEFFSIRVSKIAIEKQSLFLQSPELEKYKHYLEKSFESAKYILSEAEERIINLKSQTSFSNWVKMTEGLLSKEEREILDDDHKTVTKSFNEIMQFTDHKDKKIRDIAAQAFYDIIRKYVEIGEAEINSILQDKKVEDELRGYSRPDQSRHLSDDIETEVVDAVIAAVSSRYSMCERYYKLKAKLLGIEKFEYYERNLEYGNLDTKYDFQTGVDLVNKVFETLDPEFSHIFQSFIVNGQLDVYPAKGKHGGAFCVHFLLPQPTFVLLNYGDKLEDVCTLAHEMGHAINNEMMRKKQHALYFDAPTSTAEVASTFMEDFVLEEVLKGANDELKLSIMVKKLNDDFNSITRQASFYEFETELHAAFRNKGYLSHTEISDLYKKISQKQMGDSVKYTEGMENGWMYISHFRRFFYVYSYASGLLISKSMQNAVKQDPTFIEKVKEFLSAGASESPKNIFAKMGIDITDKGFWDKGLDQMEQLLNDTEALAKKLGKV